jgi:hypothetical protein
MTIETKERDAELDELLDDALDMYEVKDGRPLAYASLEERLAGDEDRTLAIISRRIQALIARKEPLDRQRDAMLDHYRSEVSPILSQIDYLSALVGDTLLARRRRNPDVKTLTLLGVGEWKSRKVNDGWDINEKAALEKLTADEKLAYVEQRDHLLAPALREHLDGLIAPVKREVNEDMSEAERIERMRAVVEAIEEQYGVTYRPERISVRGPLE